MSNSVIQYESIINIIWIVCETSFCLQHSIMIMSSRLNKWHNLVEIIPFWFYTVHLMIFVWCLFSTGSCYFDLLGRPRFFQIFNATIRVAINFSNRKTILIDYPLASWHCKVNMGEGINNLLIFKYMENEGTVFINYFFNIYVNPGRSN